MTRASTLALLLFFTLPASAQDTVSTTFDFEAVGADQAGMYDAGDGGEVAGGVGRIQALADWHERAQLVRVAVGIDNMGVETQRGVVSVGAPMLDATFRGRAALDGEDVTAYLADGTMLVRPLASNMGLQVDALVNTFHQQGVGLVVNDVPHIPFVEEYEFAMGITAAP